MLCIRDLFYVLGTIQTLVLASIKKKPKSIQDSKFSIRP